MLRKISIYTLFLLAISFGQVGEVSFIEGRVVPKMLNYQGYLTDTLGIPITDSLNMKVKIYDAETGGNLLWNEIHTDVPIEQGVFNVLLGSVNPIPDSVFIRRAECWLELDIGPQTLSPRTRITAVGYAYTAAYADTAEYAKSSAADNDWVRGTPDSVLFTAHYLGIARGSADNMLYGDSVHTHTNFGVACTTGISGQNQYYCTVGGGKNNVVSSSYATVGGGYYNSASSVCATVFGGVSNTASGEKATVAGGGDNIANYYYTTVGGGWYNTASGYSATVAGGWHNNASGLVATVGGGYSDTVNADYGGILSGNNNLAGDEAADTAAVVVGGWNNLATGKYSFVAGGRGNTASGYSATVGGGYSNTASDWYATAAGGYADTVKAYCGGILSGYSNLAGDEAEDTAAVVVCGWNNSATGRYSFVGGGKNNTADSSYATVAGGSDNTASGRRATVSGGWQNTTSDDYATVAGGYGNTASDWATVAGGYNNTADSAYATVGGGYADTASGWCATIGGGSHNTASGDYATVGGGNNNTASDTCATVAGGFSNDASGRDATVAGGRYNTASDSATTVGGGLWNTASSRRATVAGGYNNTADSAYATVDGGGGNTASGYGATVGGGKFNFAAASYSFATNYSTYVLSDHDNSAAFTTSHTTNSNQVRAASFSTGTMAFTLDHPSDPMNKILNQYAVGSSEVVFMYNGTTYIADNGRVEVFLPDYFDKINRNPRIQLTGVGTSDIYVAEEIIGNRFVIGGKPNTKVYWTVIAERKDIHAKVARTLTPAEQVKTGDLIGHSLDDDALIGIYDELESKRPGVFEFRTAEGRRVHEESKRMIEQGPER